MELCDTDVVRGGGGRERDEIKQARGGGRGDEGGYEREREFSSLSSREEMCG